MVSRTRLLLADDHAMLLETIASFVRPEFDVVATAGDGRAMVDLARQSRPDVISTDISMPLLNGIDATRILRKEGHPAKVLFLTMHADLHLVEEAFRAGASGYVLKSCGAGEFIAAVHKVARGGVYVPPALAGDLISTLIAPGGPPEKERRQPNLTVRQREVLQLLAEGRTMKQVAAQLGITTRTTESHKYEIMRHLGIKTTAELIRYAVREGLV